MKKLIRSFSVAAASLCVSTAVLAQTEVSFYFPVAVGGPITKIIDGYAADFKKKEPQCCGQTRIRWFLSRDHR